MSVSFSDFSSSVGSRHGGSNHEYRLTVLCSAIELHLHLFVYSQFHYNNVCLFVYSQFHFSVYLLAVNNCHSLITCVYCLCDYLIQLTG